MSNHSWRQRGPPDVNNAQGSFFSANRNNNNTANNVARQNSSRYNINNNNNSINTSYRSNDTNWGNIIGVRPGTGDTGQQKDDSGARNQPRRQRLDNGSHQNSRPQWSSNGDGGGRRSSHYDNQNNVSLGGVRNGRGHGPPHNGRGRFDVYVDSNNGGRHGGSSNGHGHRDISPPVNFRHGNGGRGGRGGRGMGGRGGNNHQRSAHGRPPIPMNVIVDGHGAGRGRNGTGRGGRGVGRGADGRTFDGTDVSNTQRTTKSTKPKNKSEVFEDIGKVDFVEGKWFPDPTSRIAQFCISSYGGITPNKHKTRMISFNGTEVVGGVNINSTEVVGGVNIVKGDNVRVTYHKKHGSWKAIRVVRLPSANEITFAAKLANPTPKVRSDSLVLRNADNRSAIPRKEFVNKRGHVSLAVQRARWREQQEEIRREEEERKREEESLVDHVNTMDSDSDKKVSGGGKVTSPKEALEKLEKFLNVDIEDEEAGVEGKASDTSIYGWKPKIKISAIGKDLRNELAKGAVVIFVPKNIPEGEHEIFYSLLRSLAVQVGSKWTLKAEITDEIKRAEELQGALQDMWNAVCGVKGSTYEQARSFTYKLMTILGVSREAKSTLMVDVVYDTYANGNATYLGRQPTFPRRHEEFTGVESEEDRKERERFGALMRENRHLPSYAPAFLTLAHASDVLRAGDVVPLILPHCNLSDDKWGISSNFGGLCNAGAPEGCIEANCTIQNLSIIAHGLPSSLDRGGIIPGAVVINTDSTCTTTIDEHCACQPTSDDRGRMVAWLVNQFYVTCKRRKICLIVIPAFGTSCGALDTCWKQLDSELYKLASKESTHPSNWSTEIKGIEAVVQSNWVGEVLDDWDDSVYAFIAQFEKDTGIKVTRPEMTMRECANQSDRLCYVAEDAEALKVFLEKQRLSRDKRIKSRVMWFATMSRRLGGDTLVYTLRSVPLDCEKWLKSNTRKMLDEHQVDNFNKLTIKNVLQTMGRLGGKNRMAKDGFNERNQSKAAVSMGNAVVKSGNQHKFTQADRSKAESSRHKITKAENSKAGKNSNLSKQRNKYIETNSTHWVMFRCLGYGDNETCPHETVRYYGNNTEGAKEYHENGKRKQRYCPCGPTYSTTKIHVEWEYIDTISDEEFMRLDLHE